MWGWGPRKCDGSSAPTRTSVCRSTAGSRCESTSRRSARQRPPAPASSGPRRPGAGGGTAARLGKYSAEFQAKLRGDDRRVDHSSAGAKIASERFGPIGRLLACAIAGHHAGLANGTRAGERTPLEERLALRFGSDVPALDEAWQDEISLPERLGLPRLGCHPEHHVAEKRNGFRAAFLARMLFSCLVDADYLDTEAWYASIDGRAVERGGWPPIETLKAALDGNLAEKSAQANLTDVNGLRADVLCVPARRRSRTPACSR